MRALRTIGWAAVGALPGVIVSALPGFIESQAENLALFFGGVGLAVAGAVVGALGGWEQDRGARWRVALGALVGLIGSVLVFIAITVLVLSTLGSENAGVLPLVGVLLALAGPFIGAAVARRAARRDKPDAVAP